MRENEDDLRRKLIETLTQPEQEWVAAFGQTVRTLMDKEVRNAQPPNSLWQFSPEDEIELDVVPDFLQPFFMEKWADFIHRFRPDGYRAEIFFKSLLNPTNELYLCSTADSLSEGSYQLRSIELEGIDLPIILDVTSGAVEAKAKPYELDDESLIALNKTLVEAFTDETVDEAELALTIKSEHQQRLSALRLLATNKDAFLNLFNPRQMTVFETSRLLTDVEMRGWQDSVAALSKRPRRSLTLPYFGYGMVRRTRIFKAELSTYTGIESLAMVDADDGEERYEFFPLRVTRGGKDRGWIIAEVDMKISDSGLPRWIRFVSGHMKKFALDRAELVRQKLN